MLAKIKKFVKNHQDDIILVIGVALVSLLSFAMGYITAKTSNKEPLQFQITNTSTTTNENTTTTNKNK